MGNSSVSYFAPNDALYWAVRERKWNEARMFLKRKRLITFTNDYGWTILHEACFDDAPFDVIQSMLQSFVEAASLPNSKGNTPLHMACWNASDEVILHLLKGCPDATSVQDESGLTPLHRAINKRRSTSVIRAILKCNPCMKATHQGKTPLDYFFLDFNWDRALWDKVNSLDISLSPSAILKDKDLRYLYEVSCLLLKASVHGSVTETLSKSKQWLVLHASFREKSCFLTISRLLLRIHPDQAFKEDQNGNMPIHLLATCQKSYIGKLRKCTKCTSESNEPPDENHHVYWEICCPTCFDELYLKQPREEVNDFPDIVQDLISVTPKAMSIPDPNGRLPLMLAIESGKLYNKDVKAIFHAAPQAIATRDISTHMFPFMLAASATEVDETTSTNNRKDEMREYLQKFTSCFVLLMEDPSVIQTILF